MRNEIMKHQEQEYIALMEIPVGDNDELYPEIRQLVRKAFSDFRRNVFKRRNMTFPKLSDYPHNQHREPLHHT